MTKLGSILVGLLLAALLFVVAVMAQAQEPTLQTTWLKVFTPKNGGHVSLEFTLTDALGNFMAEPYLNLQVIAETAEGWVTVGERARNDTGSPWEAIRLHEAQHSFVTNFRGGPTKACYMVRLHRVINGDGSRPENWIILSTLPEVCY